MSTQNISAKNTTKVLKDKREAQRLQLIVISLQQDNANLWSALNNLTLQLDYIFHGVTATGFTFAAFNPLNGASAGTGWTDNTANLPQTNNDQVGSSAGLIYNNAGASSLHLQP